MGKVSLDVALELSLYLSKETEIMPVTQGLGELVPIYKLMEKRNMLHLENQMKVRMGSKTVYSVCGGEREGRGVAREVDRGGGRAVSSNIPFSQGYIVELFQELIDRQTWSDEGSVSQRVLRSYLLLFACVRNHPPCVATASRLFTRWRESDGNMRLEVTKHLTSRH